MQYVAMALDTARSNRLPGMVREKQSTPATELEKLAPKAEQLSPLLRDPQVEVRRGAAFYLLSLFDPANPEQVAALTSLLADDDRAIRSIGRAAVAEMRPADQIA